MRCNAYAVEPTVLFVDNCATGGNCCEKFRNVCGKGRIRCQARPRASRLSARNLRITTLANGYECCGELVLFSRSLKLNERRDRGLQRALRRRASCSFL